MSALVWFTAGVTSGLGLAEVVRALSKVHVHRWGPWSRVDVQIVNRGYEVTKQHRFCKTCNREKWGSL